MDRITEIRNRVKENREKYNYIVNHIIKASCPQGYKEGTSYQDYDAIKGSKKEINMVKVLESLHQLESIIYLDEIILENLERDKDIEEKLKQIETLKDKIYYLRKVQGYTQERAAEVLGISDRHVRRLEKEASQ